MPYKGSQQPDLVGLALNLMQMKRDRELDERKLALEEFKAQQVAQQNAISARRDEIDFGLSIKEREASLKEKGITLDNAQNEREYGLGSLIETANNPARTEADRYSSARAFDLAVQNQVDMGRDPTRVGANAGAGLALKGQAFDDEEAKANADMERSDTLNARDAARAERYRIAAEKRAEQLEKTGGIFNGEALRATRTMFNTEIEPAKANEKAWGFYERFDPNNKQQIIDAVQLAQRAIDPVNVTEGDMRLRAAAGLDSQEALARRVGEWASGAIVIPVELGPVIKENLREKLEIADDMSLMTFEQQEQYVIDNKLDESQRNFVLTQRSLAKRVRDRVKKRGPSAPAPSGGRPAVRPTGRPPAPNRVTGQAAAALGLK